MKLHTTLRLGGKADLFVEAAYLPELSLCLRFAAENQIPVFVLGNGSNVLIQDEGFRGMIIHFGREFSHIEIRPNPEKGTFRVTARAGASLQKLCSDCAEHSLTGLEFACGIPGSVGGAICMNAGAYGHELKEVFSGAELLYPDGHVESVSTPEMHLGYRHSLIMELSPSPIILQGKFTLLGGDSEAIHAAMRDYAARRKEKQPLHIPGCGSTFKRPEGHYAGALIEQCGLKGFRVGGCSVSTLHAGFLLNDAEGTAEDYLKLMEAVQNTVWKETGVRLEPEVQILKNR